MKPYIPFAIVHVDLFFMPSQGKSKACLLVICAFSKWIEALPLNSVTSKEVWRKFKDEILFRYGPVNTIICDNGREFLGTF